MRILIPFFRILKLAMSIPLLIGLFLLSAFSGFVSSATVTLDSIMIFQTHELLKVWKPEVYFECKSANKTDLPDVKIPNHLYTFNGQESWQPLTELSEKKCKRCGFYEKDIVTRDTFHEWEFCPSDFTADGKYYLFKDKEVNATFSCPQCIPLASPSDSESGPQKERKGMHGGMIILISTLVSTVFVLGSIGVYKYWQKKKRQEDQARFLKLFEEGDDIEDELELGNVL